MKVFSLAPGDLEELAVYFSQAGYGGAHFELPEIFFAAVLLQLVFRSINIRSFILRAKSSPRMVTSIFMRTRSSTTCSGGLTPWRLHQSAIAPSYP